MTRATTRASRWFDAGWWLACALLSSLWCLTAAPKLSATFDETLYVRAGLDGWRSGSHRTLLREGTMPLPADVQTLPLYLWEKASGETLGDAEFHFALGVARAANLPFWWILLASALVAGRSIGGPWGGRLAVAWLACEPNLLAHATLATTDIALASMILPLAYCFRRGRRGAWPRRIGVPALWFGLALAAKASAMVMGVLCMLLAVFDRLQLSAPTGSKPREALWPLLHDIRRVFLWGTALAFVYCGSDFVVEPSFVKWAQQLPDGELKRAMVWTSENLRIFSNAGEALVRQIGHNLRGHAGYLLGIGDGETHWWFFPALSTVKLSEPLLVLFPLIGLLSRRRLSWAWMCAAGLLVASVTFRVQLGIRMILPMLVFAVIATGGESVRLLTTASVRIRQAGTFVLVLVIAWTARSSIAAWPDGLRYVNRFWGGSERGYELVADSSYDWGQGLLELADWRIRNRVADLDIWYFGTDPRIAEMPMRLVKFHDLPITSAGEAEDLVRGRRLAVSSSLVYGPPLNSNHPVLMKWLRGIVPVDRTSTFFIYDFRAHVPLPLASSPRKGFARQFE